MRKLTYTLFLLLLMGVTTLASFEIMARIAQHFGPSSFRFRQFDPDLGASLIPGRQGIHRRCYDGYIYINRHGMRDRERQIKKRKDIFRIAVFSDSVMEAVHVRPEETAIYLLEEMLNTAAGGKRFEVLNFSVGGFSTYQEYLHYLRDGRQFNNDLIVVVLTDNDLQANFEDTIEAVGNLYPTAYLKNVDDEYLPIAPKKPLNADKIAWFMDHSAAFFLSYKLYYHFFRSVPEFPVPEWANESVPAYRYLDFDDTVTIRSWKVTEYILDQFVEQVRRDEAQLMLVYMGYDVGGKPWYRPVADLASIPDSFDPAFASKWFRSYGLKKGIMTYNLGAALTEYVRRKGLSAPYLSFSCDSHFNPEGQAVIADSLYEAFLDSGLVHP